MQLLLQYAANEENERIRRLEFSPTGPHLVTVCGASDVVVFQVDDGLQPISRFNTGYRYIYNSPLAVHPQKPWLCVSADWNDMMAEQMPLRVFNWWNGTVEREYIVPENENQATCFSPNGNWLVSSSPNHSFICISLESNQIEWQFPADEVNCTVYFHPNGKTVMVGYYRASWQWGSSIDFWDLGPQMLPSGEQPYEERQRVHQEAKKRGSIELECDYINGAVFSPDGSLMGVSHQYPALYSYPTKKLFSIPPKKLLWTFGPDGQPIEGTGLRGRIDRTKFWTKPVFTPDSRSMLCGSPDGIIFRWDVKSGRVMDKTEAHNGRVWDISLSSGGKTLASCGADGLMKTWAL